MEGLRDRAARAGGSDDLLGSLTSFYAALGVGGSAGETRDIVYFVVLAVGTALLLAFGYFNWDRPEAAVEASPRSSRRDA